MKILIVTKNWLGDILFEIPAMDLIRQEYPQAEIVCLTHPRCHPMLEGQPALDRILEFDERGRHRSFFSKWRFLKMLRREKFDRAYFFHRSRTRAFLGMLAGIRERIGYGIKKPHFLTVAIPEPSKPLHQVDYFLYLVGATGRSPLRHEDVRSYAFHYSHRDQDLAIGLLQQAGIMGDYICFHLGANWEPKRWPADYFAMLADSIAQKISLPMVLTGGAGDMDLGRQVMGKVSKAKVVSLIGKTTLAELGALFAKSRFVISGDSGPMHIASGAGARVLALFGPTHPDLTGPRGIGEKIILSYVPPGYQTPWYGRELPKEGWLSQIQPSEVLKALESKNWLFSPPSLRRPNALFAGNKEKFKGNILWVTMSNIGDVILSTPVLMSLAAQFPHHHITAVVGPRAQGVLAGSRTIHELVMYDKKDSLKSKIDFIRKLRKRSYDVVVDLKNSAVPFLVSAEKRSPFLRFFKAKTARAKHLEIFKMMHLESPVTQTFDFYGERDQRKVRDFFQKPYVVLAPVAASELKSWPLGKYKELIDIFLQQTDKTIVLAGGNQERKKIESLVKPYPARVINFAGETSLRELAALIAGSDLLVANDSAAAHMGFEMNHPSVVIYGPTDPEKYARQGNDFRMVREPIPCSPCELAQCKFERQACLLDLEAAKVWKACEELLSHHVKVVHIPS